MPCVRPCGPPCCRWTLHGTCCPSCPRTHARTHPSWRRQWTASAPSKQTHPRPMCAGARRSALHSAALTLIFPSVQTAPTAEEALEHLIFLADVNKLYDVALGMYDVSS